MLARWLWIAVCLTLACSSLPPTPTPNDPIRGCSASRSNRTGSRQWERVIAVGEYSDLQYLVLLPDRLDRAFQKPVPFDKAKFTQMCPAGIWGTAMPAVQYGPGEQPERQKRR